MGLHISLVRLVDHPYPFSPERTPLRDFDFIRHQGDREFVGYLVGVDQWDGPSGEYCRPVDLAAAKQWVTENVYGGNRLLPALERMETEPDLWFEISP